MHQPDTERHKVSSHDETFTLERRNPKSGPVSVFLFSFLLKGDDDSNGYLTHSSLYGAVVSYGMWRAWNSEWRRTGTPEVSPQVTTLSNTINELIVRLCSEAVRT